MIKQKMYIFKFLLCEKYMEMWHLMICYLQLYVYCNADSISSCVVKNFHKWKS